MRSYGQYCSIAKALDVVGDRWSLLIVRELLGGCRRYRELQDGLPGIATNLLAERLRHLEAAGVVTREEGGAYQLTAWGQQLAGPIDALGWWGARLMGPMEEGEQFRAHWLVHPVRVLFGGPDGRRGRLIVEVRPDGTPLTVACQGGRVQVSEGAPARPDVVVSGRPDAILGLLAGRLDPPTAESLGAHVVGDARLLRRLRPRRLVATPG